MEFVFVVPRRALFPESAPHGFAPFLGNAAGVADGAHFERVVAEHGFFVERARAEREPDWKQVIPYTLVARRPATQGGSAGEPEILLLTRSARGGDARLHHKMSIGVGGHVEPIDCEGTAPGAPRNPLRAGSARELAEELHIQAETAPRPVGLLNDDTNAVGAVHVGLVQVLEVPAGTGVEVREAEVLTGRLLSITELERLVADGANLESWSRLLVPHLRHFFGVERQDKGARTEAAPALRPAPTTPSSTGPNNPRPTIAHPN
ncbi:MAG: hypothetical protein GC161_00765 [Planctomycetaceae bacterium]|nr:hypothetical protein [Planctomycetaceae bacterium]